MTYVCNHVHAQNCVVSCDSTQWILFWHYTPSWLSGSAGTPATYRIMHATIMNWSLCKPYCGQIGWLYGDDEVICEQISRQTCAVYLLCIPSVEDGRWWKTALTVMGFYCWISVGTLGDHQQQQHHYHHHRCHHHHQLLTIWLVRHHRHLNWHSFSILICPQPLSLGTSVGQAFPLFDAVLWPISLPAFSSSALHTSLQDARSDDQIMCPYHLSFLALTFISRF